MKIGVLGASGFVGSNLSRHLASNGHEVRVLTYHSQAPVSVAGLEWRQADVRAADQLEDAFAGLDVVINCAALFNHPGRSRGDYESVNHHGARNVVEAAAACGAGKVIHISTVGVALSGSMPYTEQASYSAPDWDEYESTKLQGERTVLEFHAGSGFPVTVVRPAQVYGPGDMSKLKFYRLVKRGAIIAPGATMKHLIYVDDLCRGIEQCLTNSSLTGRAVILANEEATPLSELVEIAARQLGVPSPKIRIPQGAALTGVLCLEKACSLAGKEPPVTRRSLTFFTKSVVFDTRLARSELGFHPEMSVEEGVAKTADWYRDRGLV